MKRLVRAAFKRAARDFLRAWMNRYGDKLDAWGEAYEVLAEAYDAEVRRR